MSTLHVLVKTVDDKSQVIGQVKGHGKSQYICAKSRLSMAWWTPRPSLTLTEPPFSGMIRIPALRLKFLHSKNPFSTMQFIQRNRRSIAIAIELLIVALLVMVLASTCSAQSFGFVSTSQFLVYPDRIDEHHRNFMVSRDQRGLCGSSMNGSWPHCDIYFAVDRWVTWSDSTVCGYSGSGVRVEWQRRSGEQVVWVDFKDEKTDECVIFQAYEHYRDSSFVRPINLRR